MDISTLHSQLRVKQLQDFYVFTGCEWAVQKIYINQIAKLAGKDIQYSDKFSDIYGRIKAPGLMAKSFVYVLRDDPDILNEEKVQKQLSSGILGKNILILLLTTVDKRKKFYKAYKDTIIEFKPLKSPILKKYLQKEIQLSDRNYERLMEVCEYDYGRCLLEIDKIKNWIEGYGKDKLQNMAADNALLRLLNEGAIYTPPKDAIFDFINAVLDRNGNGSYNLYNQCLAVGEAVMVMVTVLYNNAKAVLQVQSCPTQDISKTTGLTGWQIKNAKPHCGVYSNGELVYIMRLCQECEEGIKTGKISEQFVMDYILTSIL